MRIFRLDLFNCDSRYCFVRGASPYDTNLQRGGPVLDEMKEDGVAALEYEIDEDRGLDVGDYFRTTSNHLPVSRRFADAIAKQFDLGRYEFVPARVARVTRPNRLLRALGLGKEKRRIVVPDIVIVNPLDAVDCLDWARSEMDGDEDDPLVRIFGKWSLKRERIPRGRDLFRVKGLIGYLFSERLVDFVRREGFANFVFEDAPLS